MKKPIYFLVSFLLLTLVGCDESSLYISNNWALTSKALCLSVDAPTEIIFPSTGGTRTIEFTTSDTWSAYSESGWIHVSPASGIEGQNSLTITAESNESTEERATTICIKSSNQKLQTVNLQVRQIGRYFTVSADQQIFGEEGGTCFLDISTDDEWTINSSVDWISLSEKQGTGSKTILATIAEYESTKREGQIIISSASCGEFRIDITQTKYQPWLSFTSDGEHSFCISNAVPSLEYSLNDGDWVELGDKKIEFGGSKGELRLRGKSIAGTMLSLESDGDVLLCNSFVIGGTSSYRCHGDIRTLVDYDNYLSSDCSKARFIGLFKDCSSLAEAPELPSTTLADWCYTDMFDGCTSLENAPELPATTLTDGCYFAMFGGCTSLTSAPELPATTLAIQCYTSMFDGCASLENAPELPATTLAEDCYSMMFRGCRLKEAPELPATTLTHACYEYMFNSCTSLTTAPKLPATTLADYCYWRMFSGCTSLTTAPKLPATTLADYCYCGMLSGCTSLTNAPKLPATTLASGCYRTMFAECTALATAPELPATTLADYCYDDMFYGCRKLNYIKMMAIDISAENCFGLWVYSVSGLGTFVKNSGATWSNNSNIIPAWWTVITADE